MSAPTVEHLRAGVEELVRESRAAQGLPPRVEDPATIARVATLIKVGGR